MTEDTQVTDAELIKFLLRRCRLTRAQAVAACAEDLSERQLVIATAPPPQLEDEVAVLRERQVMQALEETYDREQKAIAEAEESARILKEEQKRQRALRYGTKRKRTSLKPGQVDWFDEFGTGARTGKRLRTR